MLNLLMRWSAAGRMRVALGGLALALLAGCGGGADDPRASASSSEPRARIAAAGAAVACPAGASINIVAHQDDDLLFLNPDIAKDIAAGRCVRTVFLTAGDANLAASYWQGREVGIQAAYARMAGVADGWSTADAGIAGRPAVLRTLNSRPTVSLVFLRLPDGQRGGEGSSNNNFESLKKLFEGTIPTIRSKDGTTSYTKASLTSALADLINSYGPQTVRTQNFHGAFGDDDHSDHLTAAFLVRDAVAQVTVPHNLVGYAQYVISGYRQNLSVADFEAKRAAWEAYVVHDALPCGSPPACNGNVYDQWLSRRYTTGSLISGPAPGTNLALGRAATASSVETSGFEPALAVDGSQTRRWSSAASDNQWLQVDLGALSAIGSVDVSWETAFASTYQIQLSTDGNNWTSVATVTATTAGMQRTSFAPTTARHVRIVCLTRGTTFGFSIRELAVYGTGTAPPPPPPPPAGANLALGRPATASSVETAGFEASRAVDGGGTTRWSSAYADNQWLQVDLGTQSTIDTVQVSWEAAYASRYQVQVSTNGTDWATVATVTPTSAGTQRSTFAAVNARYVRIACLTRATGFGFSIFELSVSRTGVVAAPPPDGVYRLVAQHSGQALDIAGISAADGAAATQWPWVAGDNQRWRLARQADGSVTLAAQHSGKLLEVAGCSLADGARVQQWPANGAPCQRWTLQPQADGSFTLVNLNSGKLLNVNGASLANGAQAIQWPAANAANERWRLEPVSANGIGAGTYTLTNVNSQKLLDVAGISTAAGANVHQWTATGGLNQQWNVIPTADGYHELAPAHAPTMRLEVAGGATGNGGNVQQGLASGSAAQRWSFERQGDGSWRLTNRNSGLSLDVAGVSLADGANVHQWAWLNGANQRWTLRAVAAPAAALRAAGPALGFEPVSAASVPDAWSFDAWSIPGHDLPQEGPSPLMPAQRTARANFSAEAAFCARAPLGTAAGAGTSSLASRATPGRDLRHRDVEAWLDPSDARLRA